MNSFFLTLICIVISFSINAQRYSIGGISKKDSLLLDDAKKLISSTSNLKPLDTFNFKLDSIYVRVEYNSEKIVTNNFFRTSNKSLDIYYYFKNDSLRVIETVEKLLIQPDQATSSKYYLENGKIISEIHEGPRKSISMCLAYSEQDLADLFRYRRIFDKSFLREYIIRSLEVIKRRMLVELK